MRCHASVSIETASGRFRPRDPPFSANHSQVSLPRRNHHRAPGTGRVRRVIHLHLRRPHPDGAAVIGIGDAVRIDGNNFVRRRGRHDHFNELPDARQRRQTHRRLHADDQHRASRRPARNRREGLPDLVLEIAHRRNRGEAIRQTRGFDICRGSGAGVVLPRLADRRRPTARRAQYRRFYFLRRSRCCRQSRRLGSPANLNEVKEPRSGNAYYANRETGLMLPIVHDSCPSDLWSPDNGPIGGHEKDAHDEWNAPDIKLVTRYPTRVQRAHDEKPHHNSEDESHDYLG